MRISTPELLKALSHILTVRGLTLSTCESCTGGMLGSMFTSIPGSSRYYYGGIISYSDSVKHKIAGVNLQILKKHGAVSLETAREMARNIRQLVKSDIGVAITGIAGPSGGTAKKPVGLVFIALATRYSVIVKKFLFKGQRNTIREKACFNALTILRDHIKIKNKRKS